MAISLTAKVGAAGAVTAVGGSATVTYYKWDHITDYHLLSLEREISGGKHTLTVNGDGTSFDNNTDNEGRKIVSVAKVTVTEGSVNKTWECKIKAKTEETIAQNTSPASDITTALADVVGTDKLSKRRWFVKNCAKHRTSGIDKPNAIESWVEIQVTKSGDAWTVDIGNLLTDFV